MQVRQRSISYNVWDWDIRWSHIYREKSPHRCLNTQINFFQFCVSYIDDYWADFSIIRAHFDGELYARGRSGIVWDTGIFGDVTFIATNGHKGALIFNAIFHNFAMVIVTTIEPIFLLFQRSLMENGTPEVDQVYNVTPGYLVMLHLSREMVTMAPWYSMQFFPILR